LASASLEYDANMAKDDLKDLPFEFGGKLGERVVQGVNSSRLEGAVSTHDTFS
jgi:hypothetical protein